MFKRCIFLVTVLLLLLSGYYLHSYLDWSVHVETKHEPEFQKIIINLGKHNTSETNSNQLAEVCDEKQNFVFVKTHKTGTSTMVNVLYHYGMMRGLNYAVYPYTHQLNIIDVKRLVL